MEIAIAGMHRSGTSMVASLLRQAGLYLGRDEEMLPPAADNPGGFWEHAEFVALNDAVLHSARAAWDSPPDQTTFDSARDLLPRARALIARFDGHDRWGWKDPRTSLTLPFWQSLQPDVRVVIVLRDPREVARSLAARNRVSVAFGLRLWRRYHEHLLTSATPDARIVTHLDSWYENDGEIDRVAAFCEFSIGAAHRARLRPDPALRHHRCTPDALHDEVDAETVEIYQALRAEAEGAAPARATRPAGFDALVAAIDNIAARQTEQEQRLDSVLRHFEPEPPPPDESAAAQAAAAAEERRERIAHVEGLRTAVAADAVLVLAAGNDEDVRRGAGDDVYFLPSQMADPVDGLALVAELEVARAAGATVLLVPAAQRWWLDRFVTLRRHLLRRYAVIADLDGGLIVDLTPVDADGPVALARHVVADLDLPGPTAVLDLHGELDLPVTLDDAVVFEPPDPREVLPYLENTVDVVVAAPGLDLTEAHRVVRHAIVHTGDDGRWHITRQSDAACKPLGSASIIIPCYDGVDLTRACLDSLFETVGAHLDFEVIAVDDCSTDGTAEMLDARAGGEPRLRVLHNAENRGFVETCNRGAAAATGDVLVFLNNDTILLPDWLEPLLRRLRDVPETGVVGGRLVYADGRLQEAGGVVFSDGSGANLGRNSPTPEASLFAHVRNVDYCSGALLATPRELFERIGGFDARYRPAYYEDTDYCFTVRAHGLQVVCEPASVIVHREGASAGTDLDHGMKRHQRLNRATFVDKWRAAL
ncbi:MAG: glycosyltransferase, partial [Acidimicrobiia bacterium]